MMRLRSLVGVATMIYCFSTARTCSGEVNCDQVWKTGGAMPKAIAEVTAAYYKGKIMVVGEGDSGTHEYNTRTNRWTTKATRPYAGNHHSGIVYKGEWFLVGGLGSQSDNKLQIYSFATNQWRKGANLPFKAGSASSAVHNGKIYTCGGISGTSTHNRCARYTIAKNRWDMLGARMKAGRNHAAHCKFNNSLVMLGGRSRGNTVGTAYANGQQLSLSRERMYGFPKLPEPRAGGGVCVTTDRAVWLFGGELNDADCSRYGEQMDANSGCALAGGLMYRPGQGWRKLPAMPGARHGIYPIVARNRIYIIGGGLQAGRSATGTVWHASVADLKACSSAH